MADEEASLSISMDAISLGLISAQLPEYGTPSNMTSGALDAVMDRLPLIRVVVADPSAFDPVMLMLRPATEP